MCNVEAVSGYCLEQRLALNRGSCGVQAVPSAAGVWRVDLAFEEILARSAVERWPTSTADGKIKYISLLAGFLAC